MFAEISNKILHLIILPALQAQHTEKKARQNHLQTDGQASERGNNQTQSFKRV